MTSWKVYYPKCDKNSAKVAPCGMQWAIGNCLDTVESHSCKESLPETLSPKVTKWWKEEKKDSGDNGRRRELLNF